MRVQMAVACDYAAEYNGRLCVTGTFDTINAQDLPFVKNQCSFAVQFNWGKSEEGAHKIRAHFMNEDGQQTLEDLEMDFLVYVPEEQYFTTTNHIITLQQVKFFKAGNYLVAIYLDGIVVAEIQLQIVKLPVPEKEFDN